MSDEMVTVPVQMTRAEVEERATAELFHDPVGIACRRWLADNPEQEREVLWLPVVDRQGNHTNYREAVPVEALRPGDRVAGRVVENVFSPGQVEWSGDDGVWDLYKPGTLVLLDPEDEQ